MDNNITNQIINFLTRKASQEDLQKLKEWLDADAANRDELKQWLATWDAAAMLNIAGKINPEDAYRRMFPVRTNTLMITLRKMAAAVVIGFMLGIGCHYFITANQKEQVAFIENIVPLGSKSEINLPDGSTVWLNAGSTLRYPTNYGKTTRDIYLTGEGYFKVAKQTDKPFTVRTALSNIVALGTEFNVKAYPDENVVETTLIEGKVAVNKGETGGNIDQTIILEPGQKLFVSAYAEATITNSQPVTSTVAPDMEPIQSKPVVKKLSPIVAHAEVSWKERNWRIESEPLKTLAVKIERRYDVNIHVDEQLKNYRFTGTIKDESLEQVLSAMRHTAPILFIIDGKNVYIQADIKK